MAAKGGASAGRGMDFGKMTPEEAMRRWPRLCAHMICESLGYFTPRSAALALLHMKRRSPYFCEWYSHMAQFRNERRDLFDEASVLALLAAARGERLHAYFLTAVKTGMRAGELCGLRWSDVDLEGGVATVRQALDRTPAWNRLFGSTKNGRSRLFPLGADVLRALRELAVDQEKERAFHGAEGYADYGLVFCQPNGRPLDPRSVSRNQWRRLKARAGLPPGLRFHDLRYTFISRALQAGANPRAVSEIVGHHYPGFTLRRYAHVGLDDAREAVEMLDEYLERSGESGNEAPAS